MTHDDNAQFFWFWTSAAAGAFVGSVFVDPSFVVDIFVIYMFDIYEFFRKSKFVNNS